MGTIKIEIDETTAERLIDGLKRLYTSDIAYMTINDCQDFEIIYKVIKSQIKLQLTIISIYGAPPISAEVLLNK